MNPIQMPPPPVEIDLDIKQGPTEEYEFLHSDLSRHINECWERAKFSKTEIVERLLKCERQRLGVYDPDKAIEISRTGGSDIFMRITDMKCRAAENWIRDVMFGHTNRLFDLAVSQEAIDLPPEVSGAIVNMVQTEMGAFLQAGGQIHPEAFRERMDQVREQVRDKMREQAQNAAERMSGKIQDQMDQGKFDDAFRDFIHDFVTYPCAVFKGPVVRRKKRVKWGPKFQPIIINDFSRDFERVSPYDIYPAPNSATPDDSFFIHRHRMTRAALQELRGVPGYNDEAIDQVIERFGEQGFRQWLMGDQERDRMEGKPHAQLFTRDVIEALEFWGSVSGRQLVNMGMPDTEIEENKEYEITAWQIGPFIIKVQVNPDPLGHRPYYMAQWNEIPGSFWGVALPEQMRDVQIMCNASARSLANNMGIASGPQAEIQIDRLPDGEDVTSMYPWKIWQTTSDRTGGGQPAVRFFQPQINAQELIGVFTYFSKQADEVTGIPAYLYSGATGGGAGRTASGLSMLMDNAAKGIKTAIAALDQVISSVVDRMYMHNMMYDPDPSIKGEFNIIAKGTMGLVMREQIQQRRNEFLQSTANPVDLQIIGLKGRAYLLRQVAEALQLDTNRIVPTPEMLDFKEEQQQKFQASVQQMQGGQAPMPSAGPTMNNLPTPSQDAAPPQPM